MKFGLFVGRRIIYETVNYSQKIEIDEMIGNNLDLNSIIKKNSQKLEYMKYILIDIEAITNNSLNEIIKSVKSIRLITNSKIILIMEDKSSEFIDVLIQNEIHNLIIIKDGDKKDEIAWEIKKSLSKEGITKYKERYEKALLKNKDIYEKVKIKEKPPEHFTKKEVDKYEKLKLIDPTKKNITINFVGAFSRAGTTSLALNLSCFLSERGLKACYTQIKKSFDLDNIAKWEKMTLNNGKYSNEKLDFYINSTNDENYEFIVNDFGALGEDINWKKFYKGDILVLVTTATPSDVKKYIYFKQKFLSEISCSVLATTSEVNVQKYIHDSLKTNEKIFYTSYTKKILDSDSNRSVWKSLLINYLE